MSALLALTACLNDTPTAATPTTLRATLNANVVGEIAGGIVGIRIGYRTVNQQFVALRSSPEQVAVAAGATVVVPVTVDIGPCLVDESRLRASEPGCLLTVELTLTDATGTPIDTQTRDARNGPVSPGQSVDFGTVTVGVTVSAVTVAPASLGMNVSEEQRLVATVRDANGAVTTAAAIAWNTSDATVTQLTPASDGSVMVRALKLGTASVTASAGGKTSNAIPVNVVPPAPLVLRQRQGAGCVLVGQTINLDVDNPPGAITWSSASPTIATVSTSGVVSGVSFGSAVITATSGLRTGTATVCVTGPLRIAQGSLSVFAGQTVQIGATGTSGATLAFSSSAPTVATVDATGLVRGITVGSATVTATATAASGSQSVPVQISVLPASVSITPTSGSAGIARTARFTLVVKDAAGATLPGVSGTWTIDDATIGSLSASTGASIDVRALKLGTTIVRATVAGSNATAQFVATQPLPAVRLEKVSGDGATCPTRSTACTFVVRAVDTNGGAVPGASVSWLSSALCGSPKLVATDDNGLATSTNLCSNVAAGAYTQSATLTSNGAQVSFSYSLRGLVLTFQNQDSFGNYIYGVTNPAGTAAGLTASVDYKNSQITGYVSLLKFNVLTTPAFLTVGIDQSLPIGSYSFDVIVSTTTPGIGPGVATISFFVDSLGFVAQPSARQARQPGAAVRTLRVP